MSKKMLTGSHSRKPANPRGRLPGARGRFLLHGKDLGPTGVIFEHHHVFHTLVLQHAGQIDVDAPAERPAVNHEGLVLALLLHHELEHGVHQIE